MYVNNWWYDFNTMVISDKMYKTNIIKYVFGEVRKYSGIQVVSLCWECTEKCTGKALGSPLVSVLLDVDTTETSLHIFF